MVILFFWTPEWITTTITRPVAVAAAAAALEARTRGPESNCCRWRRRAGANSSRTSTSSTYCRRSRATWRSFSSCRYRVHLVSLGFTGCCAELLDVAGIFLFFTMFSWYDLVLSVLTGLSSSDLPNFTGSHRVLYDFVEHLAVFVLQFP